MGFHHYLLIYTSCVWSYHNQLFTVHHLGYYSLVSLVFGTTIPTSFNILMKLFFTLVYKPWPRVHMSDSYTPAVRKLKSIKLAGVVYI